MNQLTMSDIQFNFSNVTIALQIGNDGKAQLTFTPTQNTELHANTVRPADGNSVPPAHSSTTGIHTGGSVGVPHTTTVNTVDATVSHVASPAVPAAPVVVSEPVPAKQTTLTPPPAAAPAAPAAPQPPTISAQQVVQAMSIPAQQVVHAPAAPAAPAEAAANFLSGNTAIPAQPTIESAAELLRQNTAIIQGN